MRLLMGEGEGKERKETVNVHYKVAELSKHYGRLGEQLARARERGNRSLCDLEVRVGEENEFIHAVVGSVHSNFIRDFVNEKLKAPFVVDLSGLCPKSVFKTLDWMYRGQVDLPWKHIGDQLMVTGRLEIPVLHCQLEEQLRKMASRNELRVTCVNIATDSRYFVSSASKAFIISLATKQVGNFSTTDLQKLTTDSIKEMIANADVTFAQKIDIMNMMLHWLRCDRYHLLDEILPHLRVPSLQHEESAFLSHLRRLIKHSDANERRNLHVYSDDGVKLFVSLDPKKFVKNSGVIVSKVDDDDPNKVSDTEIANQRSCNEVNKVVGRYDFDASDLKELENLPGFSKKETKKQSQSKTNNLPAQNKSNKSIKEDTSCRRLTKAPRKNRSTSSNASSVNAYKVPADKSTKTVGRLEVSDREVKDIKCLPSITTYSDARVIRGQRGFTKDDIRDIQRVPDLFGNGSVACSTIGPSSGTIASHKKYPSLTDPNYSTHGIRFGAVRAPSNVSTCVSTAVEPEKSDKTIGRHAMTPKELRDLRCVPSISAYSDARVVRGKQVYTQDEIREMNRLPDYFDDSYTRHWVENGRDKGYSASAFFSDRPQSLICSTVGPASGTYRSYGKYPSLNGSDCGNERVPMGPICPPQGVTINKGMRRAESVADISRCPSICSEPYVRIERGNRCPDSIADIRAIPDQFNDLVSPFSSVNGSSFGRYPVRKASSKSSCHTPATEPFATDVYGGKYRTPSVFASEISLATSADIRDLPDVFARTPSKTQQGAFGPFPPIQESICSDYHRRPRTISDASTQLEYPDIDASDSAVIPNVNPPKKRTSDVEISSISSQYLASGFSERDSARIPAPIQKQQNPKALDSESKKKENSNSSKKGDSKKSVAKSKNKSSVHLKLSNEPKRNKSEYMFAK